MSSSIEGLNEFEACDGLPQTIFTQPNIICDNPQGDRNQNVNDYICTEDGIPIVTEDGTNICLEDIYAITTDDGDYITTESGAYIITE